jgi:hypothetical protein
MSFNNRQKNNRLILEQISAQVEAYPDLRFQQILQNLNITELDSEIQTGKFPHDTTRYSSDKFYEESEKTLEKVMNSHIQKTDG